MERKLLLSTARFPFLKRGRPTNGISIISASTLLQHFFGNCPFRQFLQTSPSGDGVCDRFRIAEAAAVESLLASALISPQNQFRS